MNPSEFYLEISRAITEERLYKLMRVMMEHVGYEKRIELPNLAKEVFGKYSVSTERQTREGLAKLVSEFGVPVGAISGQSGRWLIANEDERQMVIADLASRVKHVNERIDKLRSAKLPPRPPAQRLQPSFF